MGSKTIATSSSGMRYVRSQCAEIRFGSFPTLGLKHVLSGKTA